MTCVLFFFFFFQAEDGIRDVAVTGVQTCALPIFFNRDFHILGIPAWQGHLEAEPIAVLPRVAIGRPHRSLAARGLERLFEQTIDLEIKGVVSRECHSALLTSRYLNTCVNVLSPGVPPCNCSVGNTDRAAVKGGGRG